MSPYQRFYHWIATTPPLFEDVAPFESLQELTFSATDISDYTGNPRLGFLYQHLCTELLTNTSTYSVELDEVQINKDNGQTLGAIDLVLNNHQTHRQEHWEVAIKFYLLHQGTWFGPNAHDQLDKKLTRMMTHQLKMSETPEFLAQYPQLTGLSKHLLLQGRLYTNPFSPELIPDKCLGLKLNQSQISGNWCFQSQWEQIGEPLYDLDKPLWAIGHTEIGQPVEKPHGRFIHAQTKSGQFWFVVPDSWPGKT